MNGRNFRHVSQIKWFQLLLPAPSTIVSSDQNFRGAKPNRTPVLIPRAATSRAAFIPDAPWDPVAPLADEPPHERPEAEHQPAAAHELPGAGAAAPATAGEIRRRRVGSRAGEAEAGRFATMRRPGQRRRRSARWRLSRWRGPTPNARCGMRAGEHAFASPRRRSKAKSKTCASSTMAFCHPSGHAGPGAVVPLVPGQLGCRAHAHAETARVPGRQAGMRRRHRPRRRHGQDTG